MTCDLADAGPLLSSFSWKQVAKDVGTRTGDQCWKRWNDALRPDLNHGTFSPVEDEILETAVHDTHGRCWSKIAKELLHGRCGLACKNRYDHIERKRRRKHSTVHANAIRGKSVATAKHRVGMIPQMYHVELGDSTQGIENGIGGGEACVSPYSPAVLRMSTSSMSGETSSSVTQGPSSQDPTVPIAASRSLSRLHQNQQQHHQARSTQSLSQHCPNASFDVPVTAARWNYVSTSSFACTDEGQQLSHIYHARSNTNPSPLHASGRQHVAAFHPYTSASRSHHSVRSAGANLGTPGWLGGQTYSSLDNTSLTSFGTLRAYQHVSSNTKSHYNDHFNSFPPLHTASSSSQLSQRDGLSSSGHGDVVSNLSELQQQSLQASDSSMISSPASNTVCSKCVPPSDAIRDKLLSAGFMSTHCNDRHSPSLSEKIDGVHKCCRGNAERHSEPSDGTDTRTRPTFTTSMKASLHCQASQGPEEADSSELQNENEALRLTTMPFPQSSPGDKGRKKGDAEVFLSPLPDVANGFDWNSACSGPSYSSQTIVDRGTRPLTSGSYQGAIQLAESPLSEQRTQHVSAKSSVDSNGQNGNGEATPNPADGVQWRPHASSSNTSALSGLDSSSPEGTRHNAAAIQHLGFRHSTGSIEHARHSPYLSTTTYTETDERISFHSSREEAAMSAYPKSGHIGTYGYVLPQHSMWPLGKTDLSTDASEARTCTTLLKSDETLEPVEQPFRQRSAADNGDAEHLKCDSHSHGFNEKDYSGSMHPVCNQHYTDDKADSESSTKVHETARFRLDPINSHLTGEVAKTQAMPDKSFVTPPTPQKDCEEDTD